MRGFADQRLRNPKDPMEASNRRISIIVQYIATDDAEEQPAEPGKDSGAAITGQAEEGASGGPGKGTTKK